MTTRQNYHDVPIDVAGVPSSPRAVIVIQEAFGVNHHIRDVTERFAAVGYYAVAPELFHRFGSPEVAYENFPEAMAAIAELNADDITSDLEAAASFLAETGFSAPSIGIVGYCMGGIVSFYAATLGLVGAAATFYGSGIKAGRFGFSSLLELAPQLQADWIGLYGDRDKGIPVEQVEALRIATAATNRDTQISRYPDADHGFHCDARPAVYNAADAADAHQRTLEFFSSHLHDK
jgi:carboxymethylenebutenolidase